MGNTLITISRQHGSGGTKVAQILAEKLGIWYYNREILYIAADKIGYDSLDEKSMDEINYKKASKYMEGLSIMTGSRNHIPVYTQMLLYVTAKISRRGKTEHIGNTDER